MAQNGDQIRDVRDVLRSDSKSLYELGRIYAIEACKEKYDLDRLKKLPREEQYRLIRDHFPKKEILAQIKLYILEFVATINVKNNLTPIQIDFIASELLRRHGWTPEDLYLFFRNAKTGYYGQFFETISPEKIIEWSELYWSDRCAVAETMNREKDQDRFDPLRHKMDPKVFEAMFKGVGEPEPEKEPEIVRKKRDTFLDSEKAFRAHLTGILNSVDLSQLLEISQKFQKDRSLKRYLDLVADRCGSFPELEEYGQVLREYIEISDALERDGSFQPKFDRISEKISTLEANL